MDRLIYVEAKKASMQHNIHTKMSNGLSFRTIFKVLYYYTHPYHQNKILLWFFPSLFFLCQLKKKYIYVEAEKETHYFVLLEYTKCFFFFTSRNVCKTQYWAMSIHFRYIDVKKGYGQEWFHVISIVSSSYNIFFLLFSLWQSEMWKERKEKHSHELNALKIYHRQLKSKNTMLQKLEVFILNVVFYQIFFRGCRFFFTPMSEKRTRWTYWMRKKK